MTCPMLDGLLYYIRPTLGNGANSPPKTPRASSIAILCSCFRAGSLQLLLRSQQSLLLTTSHGTTFGRTLLAQ